jgi:hypothetical protein
MQVALCCVLAAMMMPSHFVICKLEPGLDCMW